MIFLPSLLWTPKAQAFDSDFAVDVNLSSGDSDIHTMTSAADPCRLLPHDLVSHYGKDNFQRFIVEFVNPYDNSDYFPQEFEPQTLWASVQQNTSTLELKPPLSVESETEISSGVWAYLRGIKESITLCWHAVSGTMNFYRSTDFDQNLIEWILTQPDRSVAPDALLTQALVLTDGNIETALLTSHNALSSIRTVPQREETDLAKKLALLSQYQEATTYDNVGPWYHFFASAYCSYKTNAPILLKMGADTEDATSQFKEDWDPTERYAGIFGVDFGYLLRNEI